MLSYLFFTKNSYFAINYLDDLRGADMAERVEEAYRALRKLLKDFGLQESPNKCCAPSFTMIFLGIEVNTLLLTLTIPREKMEEILEVLKKWKTKSYAMLKEVRQLAGLLNFACRCVRSGRAYLSRILNFLRTFDGCGDRCKRIPSGAKKDIWWWVEFTPRFNGTSCMLENQWTEPDLLIESDSCMTGGGACTRTEYFHFRFPQQVLAKCKHINELECIVLVVAVQKWAPLFTRKGIQMFCDNQVTVFSVNSGSSRNHIIQACLCR